MQQLLTIDSSTIALTSHCGYAECCANCDIDVLALHHQWQHSVTNVLRQCHITTQKCIIVCSQSSAEKKCNFPRQSFISCTAFHAKSLLLVENVVTVLLSGGRHHLTTTCDKIRLIGRRTLLLKLWFSSWTNEWMTSWSWMDIEQHRCTLYKDSVCTPFGGLKKTTRTSSCHMFETVQNELISHNVTQTEALDAIIIIKYIYIAQDREKLQMRWATVTNGTGMS